MRKIYHVEIEEILQNVYEIEANSYEEAEEIARERYRNEEYILVTTHANGSTYTPQYHVLDAIKAYDYFINEE